MSITQRHNTEPLSGAAFTLATRTIGTVTHTTPDFDALVTTVLPHIEELTEDSPVTITVEADKLSLAWTGGALTADRYALSSSRTVMRRLGAGQVPEPDEHLMFWVFLTASDDTPVWSGRIFDPVALVKIIDQWHHVPTPGPITFSPTDLAPDAAPQGVLQVEVPETLPGRELVPEQDAAAVTAALADLDPAAIAEQWPRDVKGRPAPRTTVILAEFGTPSTTKKQPCLVATSATLKDACATVSVARVYVDNSRFNRTVDRRADGTDAPPPPSTEPGWFDRYAAEHGVEVDDSVRLLAAGEPWTRFGEVPDAWPQELRAALADIDMSMITPALGRIRDRVDGSRKNRLKIGELQRRMVLFSGQREQSKWGLFLAEERAGTPLMTISHSAANAVVPDAWWRRDR